MQVVVAFDMPMNQALTPALGSFEVVCDGVPVVPVGWVWSGPTLATIAYGAPDVFVLGMFNYLTVDTNLQSLSGVVMTAPQSVQFFP